MMKLLQRFALAFLLFAPAISAATQSPELRGKVVSVADGDTITILTPDRQQHKIRFNGYDAPESSQDFGEVSKKHLADLVFGKDVTVLWSKRDKYGRIIGPVNVNLEQLKAGLAWYYRQYAGDVPAENRAIYERAEAEARAAKRGLCAQSNPVSPWAFRHGDESPSATAPSGQSAPSKIIGNRNLMIYHLVTCPDYQKTVEKNCVYFDSVEAAEKTGFRKAKNCP